MDFSVFYTPSNFRFGSFDWLNKGAFLLGGLGLAAAYAFGLITPALAQSWTFLLLAAVLGAMMVVAVMPRKSTSSVTLSLLMLLAVVFTFALPATANAADCSKAQSFSDPCYSNGGGGYVIKDNGNGWQRVGKTTIYVTGKTADGKYNVYNVEGEIDDFKFTAGNARYTADQMITYLDGVPASAVGKNGIRCDSICKNSKGQVIGVPEGYKKIAVGKKK